MGMVKDAPGASLKSPPSLLDSRSMSLSRSARERSALAWTEVVTRIAETHAAVDLRGAHLDELDQALLQTALLNVFLDLLSVFET
jgi:alkylhydroperoxidase family enzyme